ncbi:alkaline phosphatase D family protein [Sphingopyxis sp. NJF-3]
MSKNFSRRDGLKIAVAGLAATAASPKGSSLAVQASGTGGLAKRVSDDWSNRFDRVWIGGEYWANPMEDWRIVDGTAECRTSGGNRSIHSLVHQLVNPSGRFEISVCLRNVGAGTGNGGAAIRIGAKSEINEYRSNCFVQEGLDAGVTDQALRLGKLSARLSRSIGRDEMELKLSGEPRGRVYALMFEVRAARTGELLGKIEEFVPADEIMGNVAIVSNFAVASTDASGEGGSRFRFRRWQMEGDAFDEKPDRRFGPLLWAMYSLNDTRTDEGHVLKLSALTGPMGSRDAQRVELQIRDGERWKSLGTSALDPDAWVATFRIANWNARADISYRLIYREKLRDGTERPDFYLGTIKADPAGRPLKMAALTCQNDYAFPYEPVANNVVRLKPDIVFFSGDQIYENHGGFGLVRAPADRAILNYLRKFYQFGWAFRDAMRHAPTVCLPDDHDVLQGNLWGEGGAPMSAEATALGRSDAWGGYIEPVRVVNAIHRTHVAHLPDPYDPTPSLQGISTYYTTLIYGNVGFAILADRQWKSGPDRLGIVVGETGQGEDPVFVNPAFDRPDLQLLGGRQEAFLEKWSADWDGHRLKAVLSQTVFAGLSTHQPEPDRYLKYDFDSSGWPATARNRTVRIMRKSKALHICGDTHLGSLSQYGVEKQRDSNWAFCTPAIAAGWPRWWRPEAAGLPVSNRPAHGLDATGEYADSFGNLVYVYAIGNPEVGTAPNRYIMAHQKGSGFGVVEFDTAALTYRMHAYRFLVDVTAGQADAQFPGWPLTIGRDENEGENRVG